MPMTPANDHDDALNGHSVIYVNLHSPMTAAADTGRPACCCLQATIIFEKITRKEKT